MADRISREVIDYAAVYNNIVEIELHNGRKFVDKIKRTVDTSFITESGLEFRESEVKKARHANVFA